MANVERFLAGFPCPVCGGYDSRRRRRRERCNGYLSADRRIAFCSREEFATADTRFNEGAGAYQHALDRLCLCGKFHSLQGEGHSPRLIRPMSRKPISPFLTNAVLERYLSLLCLEDEEQAYLVERGADELEVAREHGYVSLPFGYTESRRLVQVLVDEFGGETVLSVPGFKSDDNATGISTATARFNRRGFVVPARDASGNLIGYQVRYINGDGHKYATAVGAHNLLTVVDRRTDSADGRLYIVEGLHKAHVAAHCGGLWVLGLPGVRIPETLLTNIRRLTPKIVVVAFDADRFENASVQRASDKLAKHLRDLDCEIQTAVWELADGKGLDDLLKAGLTPRLRVATGTIQITGRLPQPSPAPLHQRPGIGVGEAIEQLWNKIHSLIETRKDWLGEISIVAAPPGLGKTHLTAEAVISANITARFLVGTKQLAEEFSDCHGIPLASSRSKDNCRNFETVSAARDQHFDVATVVCAGCKWRDACRTQPGGYFEQFERVGPMVGTTEMLYSGAFMNQGDLVVLDDADLARPLIDERSIDRALVTKLAVNHPEPAIRRIAKCINDALELASATESQQEALIGPDAWDLLSRSAGSARELARTVRAAMDCLDLILQDERQKASTPEDIKKRPPAILAFLISTLAEELEWFESGAEFNSGISLTSERLEIQRIRPPLAQSAGGPSVLRDRAVLVLDATPLSVLYERLAPELRIHDLFRPVVALPAGVTVTQYADQFFGKVAATVSKHRRRLLEEFDKSLGGSSLDAHAVVALKDLVDDVVNRGYRPEQVLNFYGLRGLNKVERADRLDLVGRPQWSEHHILKLANVLHKGEAPINRRKKLRLRTYDGYIAPDGSGRAIEIVDFVDPRVSAILEAGRESEMLQAIHRVRPLRIGGSDGRSDLPIVIHTSQPIPGLPVDKLVCDPHTQQSANAAKKDDAEARILAAIESLTALGRTPTYELIAKGSGASTRTIAKVFKAWRAADLAPSLYTAINDSYNGVKWTSQIPDGGTGADGADGEGTPTPTGQARLALSDTLPPCSSVTTGAPSAIGWIDTDDRSDEDSDVA